jgi:hypothetical protein
MRFLSLGTLFASLAFASNPAALQVDSHSGKFITFGLQNRYRAPASRFEVAVAFGSNLGCTLQVEVKHPSELKTMAAGFVEPVAVMERVPSPARMPGSWQ